MLYTFLFEYKRKPNLAYQTKIFFFRAKINFYYDHLCWSPPVTVFCTSLVKKTCFPLRHYVENRNGMGKGIMKQNFLFTLKNAFRTFHLVIALRVIIGTVRKHSVLGAAIWQQKIRKKGLN